MKKAITYFSCVFFTLSTLSVSAQLYWDINGTAAGAGGATPSGTWDGATANWNSDSTGGAGGSVSAWVDGSGAFFAAGADATGSYTVTVSGTRAPSGITFEEGAVTLNGGTLDFSGGGNIQVDAALATINSVVAGGSGQLTKLGTGTLVLGGSNTFTNTVSVVQGTVRMGASGDILPTAAVSVSSGATLDLNNFSVGIGSLGVNALSVNSSVTLGSGTLTNLGIGANSRYDGVISGSGVVGLVKTGTNALTLGGLNTFTGKTVILGGVLALGTGPGANDLLGTPPGSYVADQLTINGGTLNFPANSPDGITTNRGIYLGPNHGIITMSSTKSPALYPNITGPGKLFKTSTGNFSLYGTNTFAGDLEIQAGGVRFNSDASAGTGKIIISPVAAVFLRNLTPPGNVSTVTNAITVNAGAGIVELVCASPDTFIMSGPISGAGPMMRGNQTGQGGILALTGDNSGWGGGLWLLRGKMALGHRNALGTGELAIQPVSTGVNCAVLMAWTPLTGVNAVNIPVTINVTNAVTNAFLNLAIGGTNALELSGPIALSSTNSPLITPIINVTNTGGTILSGVISGGAGVGLIKEGAERLTLSGANNYPGVTTINAGTLLVNAPGSLAGGGVVVNSGGTLGGSGTINGAVTVNSGGSVGAGSSAGTLTFASGLNLSAGGTNVWELVANSTGSPGGNYDQIVLTGGSLVLGGSSALQVNFTGSVNFTDPFWGANHSWKIINGSNPGSTTFASFSGTNGITAGAFAVSADTTGVFLNYTTSAAPSAPRPRITSITGAGTTSVIVNYTNTLAGTNYVLQYNTNLTNTAWINVTTNPATGTTASQTNNPPLGTQQRYYRVYYVTP